MKDQKGLVVSRLTITAFIVAFLFVVAQLNDANKQLAQDKTIRGLHSISEMHPEQMMNLNSQFSGDPTAALKEASLAPDLKTITESEYQDLLKNAVQVITTNAPEQLANGATVTSSSFRAGGSSTIDAAAVTSDQGPVLSGVVAADSNTVVSSGTAVMVRAGPDGSVTTSYNSTPPSTVPEGAVTVSTDGTTTQYANAVAINADAATTGMAPIMVSGRTSVSVTKASSYVSYTNMHGDTVVIGFDSHNNPVLKSVFKK